MTPFSKILLIILAVVVLSATGWIIALNIKLSTAKNDNLELKTEIALKEIQIAKAEASIKEQNDAAERMKSEAVIVENRLKTEYDRINKKYALLKDKTESVMENKPDDCQLQLKLIYEAQEAFCYE